MEIIEKLIDIAQYLGLCNIVEDLESIRLRSQQENANLVLPLVGEFSSGKTTLINALTDSKKLETATKPTTATIYEVHFGCDVCKAKVLTGSGEFFDFENIGDLKNDSLSDATVVTVFDTSSRVSSSTILVDTPGLSSPDPQHKQTLVNFLPKADGILLVTDINQQITRSLTDFIETMRLSMKPIFLVLTKSDTKSEREIEEAKKYICDNCKIPLQHVVVVSAQTENLDEFYNLLDRIQIDKKDIIEKVDRQRIKSVVRILLAHIDSLLIASKSDKDFDEAIRLCQLELDKFERNIDRLVDSMSESIKESEKIVSRKFEDTIFFKLNGLVTGKSNDFDAEAISMINNTSSLLMQEYTDSVKRIISEKVRSQKGTDCEAYFGSINDIDLSGLCMTGLSYNLELNSMGHQYDQLIKTGLIAAAAIGTVATIAVSASNAISAGSKSSVASNASNDVINQSSTNFGDVIDVADTVTDVASIVSNQRAVTRMERAAGFMTSATQRYNTYQQTNQMMGQQVGSNKGLIDSMVGFVTDKLISKPQRIKAIRNYIDTSLAPEFKDAIKNITEQISSEIRMNMINESSQILEQKRTSLNQLKNESLAKKADFERRINQLHEFKTILLTI